MTPSNKTDTNVNALFVLFNVPNIFSWIRIVLIFVSLRYFGRRNYLLFVVYHVASGLLDSFDGTLARMLNQKSFLGGFFENILDSYSHFTMNACVAFLYPSYIVYFFLEIALESWTTLFDHYLSQMPKNDLSWLHRPSFLARTCSVKIYSHPNLRLLNWYGPDVFHVVLVLRYILVNDCNKKIIRYIQRYISLDQLHLLIKCVLCFTGFFALLRSSVYSCFLIDKVIKLAEVR